MIGADSSRVVPVIRMTDVCRTYAGPPRVAAISSCNLVVSAGDYLAIVGPSGSGKSTLLNIIGLLDRPSSGSYQLEGIEVAELTESERAALRGRLIGFVFQSFHLLPARPVLENVMLATLYSWRSARHHSAAVERSRRRRACMQALERVGMADRSDAYPSYLSGGERQRVAIARALVNEPSILLCDEPTGNLDSANAAHVLEHISTLNTDGLTIVMITHDNDVVSQARRAVAIRDGQVGPVVGAER